ncbi:hypothetical protein FNW02_20770 [Komarekiella sp. 'clone 1']|uniref:Uncharacterized protein n=1 Tax=Komarekiella delphini-convector SJRDD-AB1 TaxID=2593771 RepID=A0AA40T017_9NOST|nr:hypothetical protein [Komarekiella delphini-convector]MBD6618189.1 hypothetical protein [Komarekiella delphini-convector SJRDD-AB1]
MEHWQFLIQKQGDRSWHTLESPNVEILEGEYRVLARSNLPNTDVEVRVSHSSTQEVPPKRRIFRRSRRTNSEGLMAVIPFTYFNPGVWELRCSGDLMSDLLGKSWQYRVLLQVLPQKIEGERGREGENAESNSTHDCITPLFTNLTNKREAALHKSTWEPLVPDYPDTISDANLVSTVAETAMTLDDAIAIPAELGIIIDRSPTNTTLLDETKEIDQPVSPVWLKGETAEQILQNLIELALPASEPLLEDETVTDSITTQPPPPLSLTLDQETYVARWGQALTINGHVELKEETDLDLAETLSLKSLCTLELGIELRSPLKSEILAQVRQSLPNQVLPFTINTSIDVPVDCESKLILADICLYGEITDLDEVIRLASQSFTITADVTELLAMTVVAKPSTPEVSESSALSVPLAAFTEPEASVSLDLELFNLVKAPKTGQSQIFNPSPKKPLPPRINPRVLREAALRASILKNSATEHSPQLPKLPPSQTAAITSALTVTALVAEIPTQEEPVENHTTMAAINLEQLVIKHRRSPMLNPTFPYLRRLKALPDSREEVKNNVPNALEFQAAEELPQLDTTVVEDKNTPELVTDDIQFQHESVAPEVLALSSAEFLDESIAEVTFSSAESITAASSHSSPLIKKWMQTQGYSPESINLQYQDDTYVPAQETSVLLSAETITVDVNLSLNLDTETETKADTNLVEVEEMETQGHPETENVSGNSSFLQHPLPQLPPSSLIKTVSAWLAQEIVIDDTHNELPADVTSNYLSEQEAQTLLNSSHSLPMTAAIIDPLPIPQLYVPGGELIAGKSITVRVEMPDVHPQVVIKLWVEDCQTRGLLDGPHLLTNLLPNSWGGLEVMTQLNIPFGCLEIRLEAIALDMVTQQESHKVTIVRTVIPPDLPILQLDELLGM